MLLEAAVSVDVSSREPVMISPTVSLPRDARDALPLVFFFLVADGQAANVTFYQHAAIALAEGLSSLGVRFVSNVDYWSATPAGSPLFRADPAIDPYSCSVVVFTSDWLAKGMPLPMNLFTGLRRPITIYIDHEDGSRLQSLERGFPQFDFVLRAHYSALVPYPPQFRPWAFGLTQRIIDYAGLDSPRDRLARVVVSYRHRHPAHSVRMHMDRCFIKKLSPKLSIHRFTDDFSQPPVNERSEHLWRITGRRHSERYYSDLRTSVACACFGGFFLPSWPHDERHILSRLLKRAASPLRLTSRRITQFDSWRLWESLVAGCATIHLDLDKYGAVLPVMPSNWVHYIGLDLDNLSDDIERILSEPGILEHVGSSGRAWSIANYGPEPTARRFLALIGLQLPR